MAMLLLELLIFMNVISPPQIACRIFRWMSDSVFDFELNGCTDLLRRRASSHGLSYNIEAAYPHPLYYTHPLVL